MNYVDLAKGEKLKGSGMDKRKEIRKKRRADFLRSLCFLMPSLIGVGIFFILPFGFPHFARST